MSYLALYRKYRPQKFEDVIDQEHITNTLANQIKTGKIGHAYLFTGSRGTGKTTTAKIFAKSINCLSPVNGCACGKCENCLGKNEQNLDILEIDAASNNGVDEIRELRESVKYPPVNGKYKVFIIDEVHMLSTSAFNALLKTLEEPPQYVVFILATTEVHKLPATILSRCMRFDFKLVSLDKLTDLICKILDDSKVKYEEKAVQLIARAGEGSVRDALSIADMVISYANGNLTYDNVVKIIGAIEKDKLFEIVESVLKNDIGKVLYELDRILDEGKPPLVLSKDLISYFRDLLVILTIPEKANKMVIVPKDVFEKMQTQATKENYGIIVRAIEQLSTVEQELRYSVQPKVVLETTMVKTMCAISLEERIEILEKKLQVPLEDKKKISQNFKSLTQNSAVQKNAMWYYGELLKELRTNSEMMTYSALAETIEINKNDNTLLIVVPESKMTECLKESSVLSKIESVSKKLGIKIEISIKKSDIDSISKKLRELFGDKLIIK